MKNQKSYSCSYIHGSKTFTVIIGLEYWTLSMFGIWSNQNLEWINLYNRQNNNFQLVDFWPTFWNNMLAKYNIGSLYRQRSSWETRMRKTVEDVCTGKVGIFWEGTTHWQDRILYIYVYMYKCCTCCKI